MAKKQPMNSAERTGRRQSTQLQEMLGRLKSCETDTVADAVRSMCPCRTAWNVPVRRYLFSLLEDADPRVKHEIQHVLFEDSSWGKKGRNRKMRSATETALENGDPVGPNGVAWFQRKRPRTKRGYYPPLTRFRR